ncbi:MAG: hypothetical protein QM736_08860 [Vicinamibacterales bacterium]
MDDAAARLVGTHDFAAFRAAGTDVETTVRTIVSSTVSCTEVRDGERLITFDVRGDGFLRHMVRAIAGSLVDVGRGRQPAAWFDAVVASGNRGAAGRTAPPHGLFRRGRVPIAAL